MRTLRATLRVTSSSRSACSRATRSRVNKRDEGGEARVDFYDDPEAPPANSLVPSVTAAVRDNHGRLLLIHKIDNDHRALPGGAMDLGESVAAAAVREVEEETGVQSGSTSPTSPTWTSTRRCAGA